MQPQLAQAVRYTWKSLDCFFPILLSGCIHPFVLGLYPSQSHKNFFLFCFVFFAHSPLEELEPAIKSVSPSMHVFSTAMV